MNRKLFAIMFAFAAISIFVGSVQAQKNVKQAFDPLMEEDAKHNMDVAWQAYGPARKAYKQVIMRFEETFAAYPDFSGMGTFLYLAGMSSYYLSENMGKQKIDLKSEKDRKKYDPVKLKADAKMYLSMVVQKYPDSQYKNEAEKTLKLLNGGK
jgi:outer membrane protein assembly factor BamD (BamD/ComL family)